MSVYRRIKNSENQWRYQRIETGRGKKTGNMQGPFFLRVRTEEKTATGKPVQRWVTLTDSTGARCETFTDAQTAAERFNVQSEAHDAGLLVPSPDAPAGSLAARMEAYLAETEANKAHGTVAAYRNTLRLFAQSCRKARVSDITRDDMLAFKTFLKVKPQSLSERSVYNLFLNAMTFIAWATGKAANDATGTRPGDWPSKPERDPEEYTDKELTALMTEATPDERLLLNALLCSGLRSESELGHLTYGDVDFKYSTWSVRPKNGHNLKTRTAQRVVPVPTWLTKKIAVRKVARKAADADLIFPNSNGEVNGHMLRIVKRVAKRAGLTGRVDDHKFRSTAITRWLRDGKTVPDVMTWVGHTNPKTILRYAAKINVQDSARHRDITKTFAAFETMGD